MRETAPPLWNRCGIATIALPRLDCAFRFFAPVVCDRLARIDNLVEIGGLVAPNEP